MSDTESDGRVSIYVGVGVDSYDHTDTFPTLANAVAEVKGVSEILSGYGYAVHVFEDPDRSVSETLNDLLQPDIVRRGGSLVILWSGHGEQTKNGGLNLAARNTRPGAAAFLTPTYLADLAARTGASQILLILDTCFSGGGVIPATAVADAILRELPPDAQRVWVGVVASSLDLEKARDGAFGALLVKLLRSGPDDDELKKRWSAHSAGVRGDDLIDALEKEWNIPDQALKTVGIGNAWIMLPNPIYKPAPSGRMDTHLQRAARGGEPDDERSYFTGRVVQIDRIVAWMRLGKPGVLAVTGPPGSGKSAIVGRIVSLSDREERARLIAQAPVEHADPGEGSVHAHVHALRYTAERLVVAIDEQLVRNGVLPPDPNGPRNRGELLGAIQRSGTYPVIALDGLNESGPESWRIAQDVVRMLSEVALVLVGTQNLPPADGPLSLIQAVGAREVIDLGDPASQTDTNADLRRYVAKRLSETAAPAMNVDKIADLVLEFSHEQPAGAFLLAQVITSQLRASSVDTSRRNWKKTLVRSIEQRVERFVENIPPLIRGDVQLPHAARELLEALAWAKGPGMPDDIWPIVATAISPTGTIYTRSDVFWLLGRTEGHVLEDGQGGRAIYRLVHQWLLDHFRAQGTTTSNEPMASADPAVRVARALVTYYLELLNGGQSPQTPAYLWRYTWHHCADAGEPGIEALRQLVQRDSKAFLPDLALALSSFSRRHARLGRPQDAVGASAETVEIYRELAVSDPVNGAHLAEALVALGGQHLLNGQWQEALAADVEAVALFRTMASHNPAVRVPLASALSVLGLLRFLKGEWAEGRAAAEEAVGLLTESGTDNPALVVDLAVALTVLGLGYAQTGVSEQARATAARAVDLFRTMDTGSPSVLPMFTWALTTLAVGLSQTGRPIEACDAAKEAVDLFSRMDVENPVVRQAFAGALTTLGQSYSQTGQSSESLQAARQAVDLLDQMDATNPGIRLTLGTALALLGTAYFQTGQPQQALEPATRAVDLFRTMDATNPLVVQALASALTVLGLGSGQTGQPFEAHSAAQEAVQLLRTTDTDNPVVAQGLASALAALGVSFVLIGQPQESLEATTEAAQLFQKIDTTNPAVARLYGITLTNHALASLQTGQFEQARDSGVEAVRLFRLSHPANLVLQPLSWVLSILAQSYVALDELTNAHDAARESVDLLEAAGTSNPLMALLLGSSLTVLSQVHLAIEQPQEAHDASKRAVTLLDVMDISNSSVALTIGPALDQLGLSSAAMGALQDALDADNRAVEVYQELAKSSPLGISFLAEALVRLGEHSRQAGRGAEADGHWKTAIASRPRPQDKVLLLLRLARERQSGDPPAAAIALIEAKSYLTDEDREQTAQLHGLGRAIRAANPADFDAAWQAAEGEVPAWLTLETSTLESMSDWLRQPSESAARDFLNQHLGSWPPDADRVALDEIALRRIDPSTVEPMRAVLNEARTLGIDEAYRSRIARQVLVEWMSADTDVTQTLLQTRRGELLGAPVADAMQVLLADAPDDPAVVAHHALLELARADQDTLAFEVVDDPVKASKSFLDLALAGEVGVLESLATLISLTAPTDADKAPVHFFKAMALARRDRPNDALEAVKQARALDAAQVPAWLAQIVRLVALHPELIPLSQALVQPSEDTTGDTAV